MTNEPRRFNEFGSVAGRIVSAMGLVVFMTLTGCGEMEADPATKSPTGQGTQEGRKAATQSVKSPRDASENASPRNSLISELKIEDLVIGDGTEAQPGEMVDVHYTGWLYDPQSEGNRGKKFDSSYDRGQPLPFQIGAGRVIRGWDEGVAGMRVGGKRVLTIPSDMAYGAGGAAGGLIPAHADLIFEVDLVRVR